MRKIILSIFIFFVVFFSFTQENRVINGYVVQKSNGEKLTSISIYDTIHKIGVISSDYGFFSLKVPNDSVVLRVSGLSFETQFISLPITQNKLSIYLEKNKDLEVAVVKVKQNKSQINTTNIGTIELSMDKVDKLPVLLGEKDVLKILQLMPGVKSGGEGSSGIYVRGGSPDQNLILLDGVPVYNASHLFGFFSVFNSDAISQVTLTKGGFPARYNGRVSSVLDMKMKEGNNQKMNIEGSIGIIASRILIEGPIKKDKTAFVISARRTYLDFLSKPFLPADNTGGYYFYDVNAKINHKINDNHHLYFSTYFGKDVANITSTSSGNTTYSSFKNQNTSGLNWGNAIAALRWNYRINSKLFVNTTFTYSKYLFNLGTSSNNSSTFNNVTTDKSFSFNYFSGINDWSGKSDFTYIPNPNHTIRFGFGDIYHTFKPGVNTYSTQTTSGTRSADFKYTHEISSYVEDDIKINEKLKVNIGISYCGFLVDKISYSKPQPRFALNYMLNESSSIKLGYARTAQFLHLLSNTGIGLPTDLWVPTTDSVPPVISDQISGGYVKDFQKGYSFSVEGYYKKMTNLIQYKEGSSFFDANTNWQSKIEIGRGWAYGTEFFLEKKRGKLTGWIGYTLSWTNRQFDNINFGKIFPYRYDRRHDLSVVMTYKLNDTWDFGAVFVYGTGNAVTLGTQNYNLAYNEITNGIKNSQVSYFNSINNYRMPAYHRLDVSANRTREKKWGQTVLSFSVYNLYNRKNPYFLYTDNQQGKTVLMQVSLFPIIPSISWKFKFDFDKYKANKSITGQP